MDSDWLKQNMCCVIQHAILVMIINILLTLEVHLHLPDCKPSLSSFSLDLHFRHDPNCHGTPLRFWICDVTGNWTLVACVKACMLTATPTVPMVVVWERWRFLCSMLSRTFSVSLSISGFLTYNKSSTYVLVLIIVAAYYRTHTHTQCMHARIHTLSLSLSLSYMFWLFSNLSSCGL